MSRYCTPEQAKRLYDLGIRDDQSPMWYNSHDGYGGKLENVSEYWLTDKTQKHSGAIPAFSSDVLALLVPYDYIANKHAPESETAGKWWMAQDYNTTKCDECDQYEVIPLKTTLGDSIAETMALLIIRMLETEKLKVIWCNKEIEKLDK